MMKQLILPCAALLLGPGVLAGDENPANARPAGPSKADVEAGRVIVAIFRALNEAYPIRPAPVPQPVDPEMLLPHYTAEFTRQFRPLLTTELRFIEKVCQSTPEQQRAVRAAGEAGLRQTVREYAELQVKLEQMGYPARQEPEWPNPRKVILEALARSVGQSLPSDQARRYQLEVERRAAARKRTAMIYTVAKLDQALLLSTEQRNKLSEVVSANWKDSWAENLEVLQHGDRYLPVLPDDQVLPILTEVQQGIWNARDKKERAVRGWTGFGLLSPEEEEADLPAVEAPADGGEPAAKEAGRKP